MRSALLYVVAAACLALIISVAWWTREYIGPMPDPAAITVTYTTTSEVTVASVAESFKVEPSALAEANDVSPTTTVPAGTTLDVPVAESSYFTVWGTHAAGLGAVILGVLLSFWLGRLTGVTPKIASRQILGISLVIGIVSYAADHAVGPNPAFTPQFVFTSLQVGFMWAAAFPMAARALGMKDPKAPATSGDTAGTPGGVSVEPPSPVAVDPPVEEPPSAPVG